MLRLDEDTQYPNQHSQTQPPLQPPPTDFHHASIAMSCTDSAVVVSSGHHGHVYVFSAGAVVAQAEIVMWPPPVPGEHTTQPKKQAQKMQGDVQYQALGFCERGERLIVATQDVSDTVEIRVWKCSDWDHAEVGGTVGQRLGSIRITTVRICFAPVCRTFVCF
jgi:hypothetical protein